MWQKKVKKTIYTLNLNREYPKEITDITYPFLKQYAFKIGANFYEITERKFPEFTPTYEKCQVYQLGQEHENDWNIFVDCDTIIHPDMIDVTSHLHKKMIAHHGVDLSTIRWRNNRFFLRDERYIGSATWFCVASDWTIELFKPLEDFTPEEAYQQIIPIANEMKSGIIPSRLIEDFVFSLNIAKYGLRVATIFDIMREMQIDSRNFLFHLYAIPFEEKVARMKDLLKAWNLGGGEVR